MASTLIGRTKCPECGFGSAHVKKSDKCTYRYCPECASQYYARTDRQVELLMAKTRSTDAPATTGSDGSGTATPLPVAVPPAAPPVAVPEPVAVPPAPPVATKPKARGLFG